MISSAFSKSVLFQRIYIKYVVHLNDIFPMPTLYKLKVCGPEMFLHKLNMISLLGKYGSMSSYHNSDNKLYSQNIPLHGHVYIHTVTGL